MKCFIYLLLLHLLPSRILLQENEVIIIGAPSLHCNENGQVAQTVGNTTILQLPAKSRALYSFKANNYLECNNLQRCTLMTWRVLRGFERYLNLNYADTKLGNVEFSNKMLLPGFNYSLHITLRTPSGQIEEKRLLLRYPSAEEKQLNLKNQTVVDLSLEIGTNVVYSTMPLVVNAKVLMCTNSVSDYMFRWQVIPEAKEISERGSELTLRNIADYFVIDTKYSLCCQVIDNENKDVLAERTGDFTVKSPLQEHLEDFQVYLPFQKTTVNVNSPITIPGFIKTVQRTNYSEFQIKWSCLVESEDMCKSQQELTLDLESGFSKEGLYLITLKVSNNKMHTKTKKCTVEIVRDVPSIFLDVNYPLRQINAIEIRAVVDELRTYCTVEWLSEGQYALDLDSIPGFSNQVYKISSKDQTFLSDIEEFGHMTVSKEFQILIPPPTSAWSGLEKYTYNITLLAKCPSLSEITDLSTISEYPKELFTISAWAVFEIEAPLKIEELDILFHNQVALKSIFSYNVKLAEIDGPIFLQYGYRFSNIDVVFYSGLNVFTAETTLPYDQGEAIETFVTACDHLNKCGKKFGPTIFPQRDNTIDIEKFEKSFIHKLTTGEYYNAVIYAIAFITSYSNLNITDKLKNIVMENIVSKLQSYSSAMFNTTNDMVLTDDASKLLKVLATYGSQLSMTQDVLDEIVNLRNQINEKLDENLHTGRVLLQMQESPSLETIKASMEMSELIIIHSRNKQNVNKEKEHLLKTVEYYMAKACTLNLFTRDVKIEMKTLAFSVQKSISKLRKQFVAIPFENNSWNKTGKFNISLNEKLSNQICLGKILLVNYFNTNGSTFGIKLFNRYQNEEVDLDLNLTVVLPVESMVNNTSVKCTVNKNGWMKDCYTIKYNTKFVKCFCPSTGYFFLEYPKLTDGKMYNSNNKDNTSIWDERDSYNSISTHENNSSGFGSLGKYSEKISFVIIASCLVGFIILSYMIKKLLTFFPQHAAMDHYEDDVYYGNLLQDDALH